MKTTGKLVAGMRKLLLVEMATLLLLPDVAQAQFKYVFNNGTVTITKGYCPQGAITIPDTIRGLPVTSIWGEAFSDCTSLTSVTIPDSVTSIGPNAFMGCTGLTSIAIPDNVTSIGVEAFRDCTGLTSIIVDPENPDFSSVDGVLFDKDQTTLIRCPQGKSGAFTVPASVTSIAAYFTCMGRRCGNEPAFGGCAQLTGVYFQGHAPSVHEGIAFVGARGTLYYLPGTTGWDTIDFGDLQAALWLPQVLTNDGSFGVKTNRFGFTINWAPEKVVVVETSTDLINRKWSPVATNTLTGGTSYFSDPQWAQHPRRFYRVRAQ